MSDINDFVIEDGVLVRYNGSKVVIPDGVTKIDDEAFHECKTVTGIAIPSSVTDHNLESQQSKERMGQKNIDKNTRLLNRREKNWEFIFIRYVHHTRNNII